MRRALGSTLVLLAVSAWSTFAQAAPRVAVTHVQGGDAPWVIGWNEAVVSIDNADQPAWRGEVLLATSWSVDFTRPSVRVPISLAAGESARLLLPFPLEGGAPPHVLLRASGEDDVSTGALGTSRPIEGVATIVELQGKAPRGATLIEVPAPGAGGAFDDDEADAPPHPPPHGGPPHLPGPHGGVKAPVAPSTTGAALAVAQVSTVQVARETGDPILPDVAVGWSGAALVVAPSDVLARLSGRPLDALEHWVRSGGTLAIGVTREEDLRSAPVVRLLGGEARLTSPAGSAELTFAGPELTRGRLTKDGDDGDWRAHGLGQTWLLRRDPWAKSVDPKSPRTIYALWAEAQRTRGRVLSLPAGNGMRWFDDDRARAFLDPNHGVRPSLGIAAILVVAYAWFVGPFAFARARKSGRPLDVLRLTPVLALGLFLLLVGLGKVGKGLNGRARRLALVEVAGGATEATTSTWHAFHLADPSQVEVIASRPIDAVRVVEPRRDGEALEFDRGVLAVRAVRAHPWQTVIAVEEGGRTLPGAVVLEGNGLSLTLLNKTPWTLEHVVLHPETTAVAPAMSRYFASVPPGGAVVARDGVAVDRRIRPTSLGAAQLRAGSPAFEAIEAIDAVAGVWSSFAGGPALPYEVPVATALVQLPAGAASGVALDRDAVFLRVVGLGGGKGKGEKAPEEPKGKEGQL